MSNSDLQNQRILITGAARRIGRSISYAFAESGAEVVVHYRSSAREAEELVAELAQYGQDHRCVQCDLTDAASRDKLIPELMEEVGPLDAVINNASAYVRSPLKDIDEEQALRDYRINFFAPFALMTSFARYCGKGYIINLLDQRIDRIEPNAGTYALAKKSLRDATLTAAVEWAPQIRVNAVSPGVVLPPPGAAEDKLEELLVDVPMRARTTTEEIARACMFLATMPTVTGEILCVDGGMHLAGSARPEPRRADYSAPEGG